MKWICPNCEYIYDEAKGHAREGWPAGTCLFDIDEHWACPDCGVREQVDFIPLKMFTGNDQDGKTTKKRDQDKGDDA